MLGLKTVNYDETGFYSGRILNGPTQRPVSVTRELMQLLEHWRNIYSYWNGITISAACPGIQFWIDKDVIPHPPKETPYEGCSCGIYASYLTVHVIWEYGRDKEHTLSSLGDALLLVDGYGRVIPGDDGFRAQHAIAMGIIDRATVRAEVTYTGVGIIAYREQVFNPAYSSIEYEIGERYGLPLLSLREAVEMIQAEHEKPLPEIIKWL